MWRHVHMYLVLCPAVVFDDIYRENAESAIEQKFDSKSVVLCY